MLTFQSNVMKLKSQETETEQKNKISFLDVNVIRKQGKLTTSAYQKPILKFVRFPSK